MEDGEHKIFANDLKKVNLREHTYCQVHGQSKENGRKMEHISEGVQTAEEGEFLNENSENNSNTRNGSNLNKTSQDTAMDDYNGKIISADSNTKEKNFFQNIGDLCPDANEEGGCVGDLNLQNITLNWPPITQSFKRKSHKSYLATWSAQISCDGFAKCLIETCNFISLDLQTMQDHYKTCNGIPNYGFNSCSSCSSWLPTGNELAMHESNCKGKKRDSSTTLTKSKDLNEAETNQSEIKDDNDISCASPQSKSCRSLSTENSGEMPNEEHQMKYCDECDIEFLSDTEFSQHLICKKNWLENLPATEMTEATGPVANTSQENVIDENNHIVQPGRPIFQGEYVRRRSFTKQHKVAWKAAIKKHKYVKCIFQNCHFLALSVEDMIYHYGYCNGDGSFARFVCHFCGGRLTRKNLLDIHVRRSHADEEIDENKFLSMEIKNEDSQPPPVSDNNESSGSDVMCLGEFDSEFPHEAPLEVEITEESTTFEWPEKAPFEESLNEEEVVTSDDLQQNNKSKSDPQTEEWGIAFGGFQGSAGNNNSRNPPVKVLNSLGEGNSGYSKDNVRKNQNSPEICSDWDYRDDHIYSKVKIRTTVGESESKDSLSVKKKKNLKHYPSKRHGNKESLRVKGEETVSKRENTGGKEIKEKSQLNKSVFISDTSRKNARKMSATPIPASQNIFKREVLPFYTSIWNDSLETNGFARCLVATCNFISLDLLHVQNHFKNCSGVPEKGPNLCTFCESRLPSSIELRIHKSMCKANGEANSSSGGTSQSSAECKKDSVSKNRTGESSNAGEMENLPELNENENKTREDSDSLKSDKDAAGGEVSPRKENTNSLRIGEIMKLKNKEIVDYNRIIQPGPVLPEGHYLRRRSYSKTHKAAWEAALEKHKYVKCLFQNCHFLAMSLEDMIYHFGYCIGDGSFATFECPHCGGRLTSKVVLDIHIQRSHSDKLSNENDQASNEEGTEVLFCTLDDWKKLMEKKELKTYAKNSPRLSIVVLQPEEAAATENPSEEIQDNSSSPDAPPLPNRKCQIRTSSEEEADESSDVNNSASGSTSNACDKSADNQTPTNSDNNNSSESQTSRARNPCEELRSDEGHDEETRENTGNASNSVPAAGKAKTDDLIQMPDEGDVLKDTSDNRGTPESTGNTKKDSNISSGKGNPGTPEKPVEKRRRSHGNPSSPEKPNNEQKPSKGNPRTSVKPIDERKRSHGNTGSPEKPIEKRRRSHGNPSSSEKPVNERKRSHGNPGTPEKPIDERKSSKGNPGTPEKPIEKRRRSQGNPGSPEKPINERKPSKGNQRTAEKSIDERRRSHGNPGSPEKPNDEQKPSHGNTSTSLLVLEKNPDTKKQETEKGRKSLPQNTKTENKNSNKNDQETKHDIRPRRKRGRSSKSRSQQELSEEENVKEVLDHSDAEETIHEAKDHDRTRKPRAKLPKIEPPKRESNVEETRNPTPRKRGRPPKRTSLRCKVLEVEAKEVAEETPEQSKRGGSALKRKSEPEEKKQISEKRIKVKCANCGFECERRLFTDHNHKKHAGLSWIEGENPIDLNDEDAVSWNVKQAFRHIKSATCGKCGSVKKSALGFISHIQNCGKSEEEKAALKVNCPHCPARILKYSLPVHLKLYHFDSEGNKSSQEKVSVGELPLKRKSALRAVNKFCEFLSQEDDEEETKKKVQFFACEKGMSKFPKLPAKTRSLWMKMIKEKKKIPCRRGSCLTESSSIQEAKNHHFLCSELPPKYYVCERCDFFTESKTVIQQHVDIHPKVDGDYRLDSDEEKSEEEADVKDAEDYESESSQNKSKTLVTSSDDNALEASLKARFFAREGLLNIRQMRFCSRSLRMTLESEMEELKKYSPVFPELRTQASDWIHVKPENATDYFPSLDESIPFRVHNAKKKSESDWKKIKRFEGEIVEDSAVIFTGGSILSMSWCKYSCLRSYKQDPKQYLAVSSSKKMEKFQNIHEERGDTPCMIQIYNCGEMKIYNDVVEVPEMAMGIVHEYGEVWDLAWFPLDAFEHSENETFLTRIGLLGAACQDGTIKIWPICDPDELKPEHSPPLYKIHPKAILELEDKADVGCLRLAIGRTGTVVGGYAGGLVAVWNLKTISSPFSKTDGNSSILKPIASFQAHKTSITALSMCQNSDRYICTSGLDRFIKFWDLESPGNPFESMQKEVCLDNVWPKHWPLTISTFEDILPSSGKGMIKAVRELYCDKHRTPLSLEGTCWSLSFNEWLNILCGCNNIGEVKVRFLRNMFLTDETFRYRTGHVVCQTELKFLKDLGQKKVEENVESCKGKSKKNGKKPKQAEENSAVPRTYDEAWKYFGLVFHDPIIEEESKQKNNSSKTSKKGNQCLEDYPITSVNKVCWNPNYKRFMQLAIGHHCGLIRIKPVKDAKSDKDVSRFLTESEEEMGKSSLE